MKFSGPHRPERVLLRRNTLYTWFSFRVAARFGVSRCTSHTCVHSRPTSARPRLVPAPMRLCRAWTFRGESSRSRSSGFSWFPSLPRRWNACVKRRGACAGRRGSHCSGGRHRTLRCGHSLGGAPVLSRGPTRVCVRRVRTTSARTRTMRANQRSPMTKASPLSRSLWRRHPRRLLSHQSGSWIGLSFLRLVYGNSITQGSVGGTKLYYLQVNRLQKWPCKACTNQNCKNLFRFRRQWQCTNRSLFDTMNSQTMQDWMLL